MSEFKGTNYYKKKCEENYITTPISVLRYITELENERKEMLKMLEKLIMTFEGDGLENYQEIRLQEAKELIKKATE